MNENNTNIPDYLKHLRPELLKSLDAAGQFGHTLQRQDLEAEMIQLNILETPFFERLEKVTATAYEHQYNLIASRQDKIGYANYKDGGVPRTVEIEPVRRQITPSLLGQRITMTELLRATTKEGVKSAEQVAREEKIIAVAEETEYQLFYGNHAFGTTDAMSPQNLQFDGIENIIKRGAPQNVLDLKGQPLSIGALWAAENKVYQTQGMARPNVAMISPIDKINLQTQFLQSARLNTGDRTAGLLGATAQSYISAYGESELVTSRFLGDWHKFSAQAFGSANAEFSRPSKPTATAGTGAVTLDKVTGDDASVNYGLDAGTYTYALKAANFNGESEAEFFTATVDGTTTNRVRFNFAYLDNQTKFVLIYVKVPGSEDFKFLKKVPVYAANPALYDDGHETLKGQYGTFRYRKVAGSGIVPIIDFNVTAMAQWIPMEQVQLPSILNIDYAIRHISSLYSRAPEFSALIVNVDQTSLV